MDDITDLRAYERQRAELRSQVIDLKRRRRVAVRDLVTVLFENAETVRFQIQEMARAEKLLSDQAIETELRSYNPTDPAARAALRHPVHRADHERRLTREAATASVHYLRRELSGDQMARFGAGPIEAVVDHPDYQGATPLSPATHAELLADLRHGG